MSLVRASKSFGKAWGLSSRLLASRNFSLLASEQVASRFSSSWDDSKASAATVATLTTTFVLMGGGIAASNVAACEESEAPPTRTPETSTYKPVANPLWPRGISDADVEALVDDCLKDPSINIPTVPDYLERQIYRSAIKLTLNAIYESLGGLHGQSILGHELRIMRSAENSDIQREFRLAKMRGSVNDGRLENVVDSLLANKAVNLPLVPDVVERQLYLNSLIIIFRLLDMLAATFSITCCGHELHVSVEASSEVFEESALHQASKIDPELMLEYSRKLGIQPETEVEKTRSWFDKFFRPTQTEFMAQLHSTLYCLVVGILDDVLEHTKVHLLSDNLQFDLVPVPVEFQKKPNETIIVVEAEPTEEPLPEPASAALPFATFTAGVGIGLTIMAILGRQ